MSAGDVTQLRTPRRRRDASLLTLGLFAAIAAAMLPVFSVMAPGSWTVQAAFLTAALLGAGLVARLCALPALVATVIELGIWVFALTALFGRTTAVLGFIPSPATVSTVPGLVSAASEEIRTGVAPVAPGVGLAFVLVAAIGALAIVLDHVVLTARMPLLAAVGLVAVSLIPTIAIPADVDVPGFVLLALALLFLLRVDTRSRHAGSRSRGRGASATALGIAAVAVLVAVVATPLLPQPALRFASGGTGGYGTTINPNLELGNDLRQPRDVDVLTLQTDAPTPPYLRAVTLSSFDGSVWQPDRNDTVNVPDDGPVFAAPEIDPDIAVAQYTTDISVGELDSPWLPVPSPATTVTGLQGDWLGMPDNRTIVSRAGSSRDQDYEVQTSAPRPTLEQIRARPVGGSELGDAVRALPADVPAIIGDTAREITAGASSPYDALIDLQTWFRSSAFRYSLDAPVEAGFDGAGLDAVADFLQARTGYCVHYASAFAVMARTLDMPSRIVVGYLPGTLSSSGIGQERSTFTVTSSQLHAWPEVYFQGIGWVPFEPTNSLGVPTSFASGSTGSTTTAPNAPQQSQSAAPGSQPTTAPSLGNQDGPGLSSGSTSGATRAIGPGLLIAAGIAVLLLILAVPAVVRSLRRRSRLIAARAGDPVAAWAAVQDDAVDLGIPVPGGESPRRFAERLVRDHGADPDDVDLLRAAVERVSYAENALDATAGPLLADAAARVGASLRARVTGPRRVLARVVPRSLVVRPGTAAAEERERVGA
ncbi:transglutaminase TgpA family protein [Microbacterium sp. S1037]|uniref:transglutaminase TgpA family protein n=1 Tax=Microbacterium sp. S1037 TaxID=3398227 RepID=UPI003AAF1AEF